MSDSILFPDYASVSMPTGEVGDCSKCLNGNCAHVSELLRNRLDAPSIQDAFTGHQSIYIPISLRKCLWDIVLLSAHPILEGAYNLHFAPLDSVAYPLSGADAVFGILMPGEGRRDVSTMLYQELLNIPKLDECRSSSHIWNKQKQYEMDSLTSAGDMLHRWSILTRGSCAACTSGVDFADLIPEADRKQFTW